MVHAFMIMMIKHATQRHFKQQENTASPKTNSQRWKQEKLELVISV
jgi:hypothetical protein